MMGDRSDVKTDFFFVIYNAEYKGRVVIDIAALRGATVGKD
jgi:hypothetical protein